MRLRCIEILILVYSCILTRLRWIEKAIERNVQAGTGLSNGDGRKISRIIRQGII
jgi:hypothetical protein